MSEEPDTTGKDHLPARQVIGRHSDGPLLDDYNAGRSLAEMAERHGLGNPRKAAKAVNAMLRRLDQRMKDNADIMRAAELVRLNRMSAALDEKMSDPKAAAELRLQSAERSRLYGLYLEREHEMQVPQIVVQFAVPPEPSPPVDVEGEAVSDSLVEIESGEPEATGLGGATPD